MIDLSNTYFIAGSRVDGKGAFANRSFARGEPIGVCFTVIDAPDGVEYPFTFTRLCRYVNHAERSNTMLARGGNKYILFAAEEIDEGEEILYDYRQAPWFVYGAGQEHVDFTRMPMGVYENG